MPIPITLDHQATVPDDLDLVVVGVRRGRLQADAPGLDEELAAVAGFQGDVAQTLAAATDQGRRLLVGLGAEADPTTYRKVGAAVAKAAVKHAAIAVDALVDLDGADRVAAAAALAEGLALGSYGFADYKEPAAGTALERVTIVGRGAKRVSDAVDRAAARAGAVALVRDLVNTPGGDLTPSVFADQAVEVAA
ncbi:MAG: hypothetical protein JWM47_1619 [Acidimicrobiales bacterium]|nr:hypothetical protein [Acidimicrobiales bacterium]